MFVLKLTLLPTDFENVLKFVAVKDYTLITSKTWALGDGFDNWQIFTKHTQYIKQIEIFIKHLHFLNNTLLPRK